MPPETNQSDNQPQKEWALLSPKEKRMLRDWEKQAAKQPQALPPIPEAGAEPETYQRAMVQWLNALHLQQERLVEQTAAMRSMLQFFVILVVLGLLVQGCQVFLAFLSP